MSVQDYLHAVKSRLMFRTIGAKSAAGYLRNRGYSLEVALVLLGLPQRDWV